MRLIDADALLKNPVKITGKLGKYPFEAITVGTIENAPTIDPIHAAGGCYCRECIYSSYDSAYGRRWCNHVLSCRETKPEGNDFCSFGIAKETDGGLRDEKENPRRDVRRPYNLVR